MASNRDACISNMRHLLKLLADKKKLTYEMSDVVNTQYGNFLDMVVASERSLFKDFQPYLAECRVDSFLHQRLADSQDYNELWAVVKQVLLLSHGQATVERGFSVNKQVAADNLAEETFEVRRIICDHCETVGGIQNVALSPALLIAAAGARQKYNAYLDEVKRKKEQEVVSKRKREFEDELDSRLTKKRHLEDDISSMEKSANSMQVKAVQTRNMTLCVQSQTLRDSAEKKKEQLKDIESAISELRLKMKDC